ncbi:MAG TPA: serine/threonine-protein kinase [Anaeromyxobacteraceae bacterium]|nr:serine/threonine-protein kinase [Anaeromyxobacteraceae bacterium]
MRDPVPFGRYLLLERVDVGGMAEVFRARVVAGDGAGRLVAVKRLLPTLAEDPELVRMFLDEARIAVQLDHPGVARVEDLGQHGSTYFIALEYVEGRPLKALLDALGARAERLPVPLACHVALRLLEALDHVHGRRGADGRPLAIVHRDVSPQNVLLSYAGEVKLVDFGLAEAGARGAPFVPGVVRGKAAYLAPEAARGERVDARADLFSAGVVLHELLAGRRLFAAPTDLLAVQRVLEAEVPSPRAANPEVPERLAGAVLSALERDPDRRPASAAALAAAIAPYADGAGAEALARVVAERLRPAVRRA